MKQLQQSKSKPEEHGRVPFVSRHVLANWIDDSHQPASQVLGVSRWAGQGGWGGWGVWVGEVPGMEGNPWKSMKSMEIHKSIKIYRNRLKSTMQINKIGRDNNK